MSDVVDGSSVVVVGVADVVELEVSTVDTVDNLELVEAVVDVEVDTPVEVVVGELVVLLSVGAVDEVVGEDEGVVEIELVERETVVVVVVAEKGRLSNVEVELVVVDSVEEALDKADEVEALVDVVAVTGRILKLLVEVVLGDSAELVLPTADVEGIVELV